MSLGDEIIVSPVHLSVGEAIVVFQRPAAIPSMEVFNGLVE